MTHDGAETTRLPPTGAANFGFPFSPGISNLRAQ
jgi:hypothetical protein